MKKEAIELGEESPFTMANLPSLSREALRSRINSVELYPVQDWQIMFQLENVDDVTFVVDLTFDESYDEALEKLRDTILKMITE